MKKRGSLNLGRRLECGFALLAWQQDRIRGGRTDMHDYTPHEDQPVATIDEIAAALGAK